MESNLTFNKQTEQSINKNKVLYIEAIGFLAFFTGLIVMGFKNFLAFHIGVELFSSLIGFGIFSMCVNTFPISKNIFILSLGIGYGFVAATIALHAFIYPGLDIFEQGTIQVTTQIWIIAIYEEAATLLLSAIIAFSKHKRININIIVVCFSIVSTICLLSILIYPLFPQCYIPGTGLTAFYVISDYLVSIAFAIVGIYYFIHRDRLDRKLYIYMELNIILTLISNLVFSRYILPNDLFNMAGHLIKVLSFYFVYKSVIEHGLNKPYSLLFNNLNEAKETIGVKASEIELINKELQEIKAYSSGIEKDILENEIFFDLLLHKSPLTIYAHSEGRFIFANNRTAEMYGLKSPHDLIGKEVLDFVPEGYKVAVSSYINEAYKNIGRVDSLESKILTAAGEILDVSLSRTTFNYNGKPVTLAILWDMSTIKQVEVLKKDAQENKRLLDESLELNKLIIEFFANLSHELRTPLNVILGALQVIGLNGHHESAEAKLEKYDKYYKTVKQNCYRLLRLINNLIDMSKIDAGFFSINLSNQNIISLIEDITMSVVEYAKNKGVDLVFDTNVEEKIMACDPDKIERVILNLLSNAIKFTSPGDKIFVTLTDEGENLTISVKDTGVGIPKQKQNIIFERFRQVDSSLSRNQEGSGIGLSLVKSLIEMHEGAISVLSEVGKGTEFTAKIPVKVLDEDYDGQNDMIYISNVERINVEFSDIYS